VKVLSTSVPVVVVVGGQPPVKFWRHVWRMTKTTANKKGRSDRQSDLEVLEEIQGLVLQELREKGVNPKVGDLLKLLELKLKLDVPEKDKEQIWELINQLREEEMSSEE
jgi:hypothetical protein